MSFDPLGLNKPLAPAIKGYIDPSLDHDAHVSHLNTIVVQVGRNKSGLEAVIAGAGEWLTSEDDKARERAALLLAELFERLPKLDIDSEKLRHIVLFLCERMNDFPSAAGSVRALLAIALGMPSKLAALRFEYAWRTQHQWLYGCGGIRVSFTRNALCTACAPTRAATPCAELPPSQRLIRT